MVAGNRGHFNFAWECTKLLWFTLLCGISIFPNQNHLSMSKIQFITLALSGIVFILYKMYREAKTKKSSYNP